MKKSKKLLSALIVIGLLIAIIPASAFAAGMSFKDVKSNAWYYNDVQKACDMNLINGKTDTSFDPNANLTYAEAIKLAACMNQKYFTGSVTLTNSSPWYQSYVDYAKEKGIISKDYDWNAPATRAGYMEIFSKALPDGALISKNKVEDNSIPDVPMTHPQAAAIYKLYRAGILQGDDATTHKCLPNKNILRCEVAAILTRMMDVEERISFTTVGALIAVVTPDNVSTNIGNTALFRVTVSGGTPGYKFQWQYINDNLIEWENCNGTTSQQVAYSTEALQVNHFKYHYKYRCKVTDEKGNVAYSTIAKLSQTAVSDISVEINKTKVLPQRGSSSVYLDVTVKGGVGPYSYTWQSYNTETNTWTDCPMGSDETFAVPTTIDNQVTPSTKYRCKVSDIAGTVTYTKECTVFYINAVATPESINARINDTVTMTVSVNNAVGSCTYKWIYYNSVDNKWHDADCTADTFTTKIKQNNSLIINKYQCIVTDVNKNQITSSPIVLTVIK